MVAGQAKTQRRRGYNIKYECDVENKQHETRNLMEDGDGSLMEIGDGERRVEAGREPEDGKVG